MIDTSIVRIKGCVINICDKINGHTVTAIVRNRFKEGMIIETDGVIHHTPDGDLGADWFENVSYHIT